MKAFAHFGELVARENRVTGLYRPKDERKICDKYIDDNKKKLSRLMDMCLDIKSMNGEIDCSNYL